MSTVGIVLSGSGYLDGAEIQESVLTLLALDRLGADVLTMAPNIDQLHVVNHITGEEMENSIRNVIIESARITRGKIVDIAEVKGSQLDALILPGGYGVAKNLSDYAMAGAECSVNPDVTRLVLEVHQSGKPIGAICISPTVLGRVIGKEGLSAKLTIGQDKQTGQDIEKMGNQHLTCLVNAVVIDKDLKIVSTPAYMDGQSISEVADGINKLVDEVLKMV